MARKRPRGYGYVHVKKQQRKRPGFTKNYKLTRDPNIFLASLLLVNYVNYMENEFPPSNCVVHDDTFDWGGHSDIIPADESDNNTSTKYNRN